MKSKPSTENKRQTFAESQANSSRSFKDGFLIAAVGASAGGIEAFSELLRNLPTDSGIAFVLIQHLDPTHQSILPELLSKETLMPVRQVRDGMQVQPDHVYVIPPNATMTISNHTLQLAPRENARVMHMPIDHFMRSLAEDRGNQSIGVILSGTGSDGTQGIAEIQGQGGVTFAQDIASAKFNGMPKSAAAAGCVDYVLPPKAIAREMQRIARHPHATPVRGTETAQLLTSDKTGLTAIFQLLRRAKNVDFTHYRQTTILRRIQRRMIVNKIDKLEEYVRYIHSNPAEIKNLYQDLLINVTSFFRDPRVFDVLKLKIFPRLMKNRAPDMAMRIWTPGCASGEESYSVAMALLEFLGDKGTQTTMQLFGTDVSETSITRARIGFYPENIQGDVSPERLRRFFLKTDGGYRIGKNIRDMCIFAQHNVSSDPPFSQMDLICCRNLLIYLELPLQSRVISMFHYALRPGGYLVLGTSEGVGALTGLFATEDRTYKIFSKKAAARQTATFSLNRQGEPGEYGAARLPMRQPETAWNQLEVQKEFDRRLLAQYAPAAAFVNEDLEIVHTRGNVNRYLKLAPGRASLNLLKMAREGLLLDLRNAIGKAKKEDAGVRKQNIQIRSENAPEDKTADTARLVNFEVIPIRIGGAKEMYFMIVFQDSPAAPADKRALRHARPTKESHAAAEQIAKLEQELAATKEYLQTVIETQEAMNEELQSANEELNTVNDELRTRHAELTVANNDLMNVLSGIDIAVVMIGKDLTIRRFTPHAQQILGLIPSDIGRPLVNIHLTMEIPDFQALVLQVMGNSHAVEKKLTGPEGTRYQLRVLPYRTSENKVDGALITLVDISPSRSR